jgi:arylsulfatase
MLRRKAAWAAGVFFCFALSIVAGAAPRARRPNILPILADDMGHSDVGSYGGEIYTPNIDRLAAQGIRFTDFHTSACCAPHESPHFFG